MTFSGCMWGECEVCHGIFTSSIFSRGTLGARTRMSVIINTYNTTRRVSPAPLHGTAVAMESIANQRALMSS